MGRFSRLGKNTTLIMVGNASSKMLAILMLPLYTSWLSVEDYGITDLITVYATFLMSFVSGCIAEAIFVIPKGESTENKKKYFTSGTLYILVSFAITALICFGLTYLFQYLDIHNTFAENLWFIFFVTTANITFVFLQQFCRAIDKMKIYSFSGLFITGITALFSFLLIPLYGVYGFVIANVCAYFSASLFVIMGTKAYKYFGTSSYKHQYTMELLKYSVPLIPNATMWWLVSASNRPLLESYCGIFSIGVLAVSYKFPGFINTLLGAFNTSWQISVLEEYKKPGFQYFFNKGLLFFAFILISASCLLTVFSECLVKIFTSNEEYYNAWIYIPPLTLSTVFSCMAGLVGSVFSAVRKSKYYFYSSIWAAVTAVVGNFVFIPVVGIWGSVIASFLSMAAMLYSRIYFARQFVKILHTDRYIGLIGFFFVFFAATLFLKKEVFFICTIVLGVIYTYINRDLLKHLLNKANEFCHRP